MKTYSWFIAKRYFNAKRQNGRFLSFIRIMAIGGIAIGAAGLLIALSVVHGFKSVINDKITGFGPEIVIKTYSDLPIFKTDTLLTFLLKFPEIETVQAAVQTQAMIQSGNRVEGVLLKGLESTDNVTDLPNYIREGTYIDFLSNENSHRARKKIESGFSDHSEVTPIIIGTRLRKELSTNLQKSVFIYSIKGVPSKSNLPDIKKAQIQGVYEIGIDKFDTGIAVAPIAWVRKLMNYSVDQSDQILIKTKKGTNLRAFNAWLNDQLLYPLHTESVLETYSPIFAWVNLQEQTIPVVIGVMIIVAAFNLIGTILMMILERTKDIGILKTMGANDSTIKLIFLLQGSLITLTGLIIGISISLLFYWLQSQFSIITLPQENYYMSTAPVEPHLIDFVLVTCVTFTLSWLASYIPSRVASRINPLKVIAFGKG
ncbi:MAG: ABC transporter permease [Bacteroidetes bacterium]|nr:ABC transporter permease [Bacteroidota bacterium]NCQ11566.1 ABC transporter permease [Bacteroidota bacterium]